MNQRHKHADVLIALAEGKDVQVWNAGSKCWCSTTSISDFAGIKYRIKPPVKKYRVALFKDPDYYTSTADMQEDAAFYESCSVFVRWLTDWIEYEE